jgi:RimJ/RimL family protein N-acetyltransferase
MELQLSKCLLRNWQLSDAPSLVKHANNKKIADNLRDAFPHPYSIESAEFFINHIANDSKNIILAICVNDEAVGGIGIHPKEDVYHVSAELGYWLSVQYWNHGIVTEATKAIVKYTFENLLIHRIYSGVFEHNKASMKVLEKCGFTLEAIHKKAVIKNSIIMDEYIWAILKA